MSSNASQIVQHMNILLQNMTSEDSVDNKWDFFSWLPGFSTILKSIRPFLFIFILLCVVIQSIKSMIAYVFSCNKPATMLPVIPLSDINNEPSWDFEFEGLFEDDEDTNVSQNLARRGYVLVTSVPSTFAKDKAMMKYACFFKQWISCPKWIVRTSYVVTQGES